MKHSATRNWRLSLLASMASALLIACSAPPAFVMDGGDASTGDGGSCTRTADCDDRIACTEDLCLVGGVCEHRPNNAMCTAPQVCIVGRGCGTGMTMTCRSAMDCDDRISCTRDTCLVDGTCQNRADDTLCPMGQVCDARAGCGMTSSTCRTAADCNDRQDCTNDICGVDGRCSNVPQNSRCPPGQQCFPGIGCAMARACSTHRDCDDGVYCNGAETCNTELACVMGTPPACADMDPCTMDSCVEATRSCAHMRDPTCMGMMARSGIYDVSPSASHSCAIGAFMLSISALNIVVTATGMSVNGAPAAMMGPAPMMGRFDVTGIRTGSCTENFRMQGMFRDATTFDATLTVMFVGGPFNCLDCTDLRFNFTGRLRM